ncbi:MAG: type II toxin-antitoxin system RelE/ParE family toxin [Ignavibacteria bacterium]|nr:type II toxin-antitoxin system RelE/ParE family toxin [Ignavibacteria bacterium]
MPGNFKLRYLPVAQADLISIFDYIAKDSPNRALAFIEKLDKRIGSLEQQPLLGRIPRHQKLREFGYRVLIVESYLVFYIIRNKEIEVHRVVHGSRSLDYLI